MDPHVRPGARDRTQPKPDLTYAFPVQDLNSSSSKGFGRDELLQTFSLQVLGKLVQQGISCTPTTGLKKWVNSTERTQVRGTDKMCFPWAVVEMKRHAEIDEAPIVRCYCQAANAAAAALEMQSQLFNNLGEDALLRPPPIIAFTCIGPIVKVWLAYRDEPGPLKQPMKVVFGHTCHCSKANCAQRMVCVWTTSVRLTWGVASLRAIIMNMHMWASRLLKPKLQSCVHRVSESLQQTCQSSSNTPSIQTPPSNFDIPRGNTPETLPVSENQSDLVPRTAASVQISQGQESPVPNHPQVDTPKQPTPNESQRSSDDVHTEISKFPASSYRTTDWAAVFNFSAASSNVQLHRPISVPGSPASHCTDKAPPALSTKAPNLLFQTTPTKVPRKGCPSTPKNQGAVTSYDSPLTAVKDVGRSRLQSPITGYRQEDSDSTEAEYARTNSGDLRCVSQSSSLVDKSQRHSNHATKAPDSQNNSNTTSSSSINNASAVGSLPSGISTIRTLGMFGRATGSALGQSSLLNLPGFKNHTNTANGSGVQDISVASSLFGSSSTNATRGLKKFVTAMGTNSSSTVDGIFGSFKAVTYPKLDLSDLSSEIDTIAGRVFGLSQPASGAFSRRSNTSQSDEFEDDCVSEYEPGSESQSDPEDDVLSVVATETDATSEHDHDSEPDEAYLSGNSSGSWKPQRHRSRKR